ncbi:MAG: hypothetical protein OXF06_00345 [Bacteroidetes bacterium]|nr:hypothetical protein [Bacteroidota bacterium]
MTSEKHIKPEDELSRNWKTFCEAREQLEAEHSGRVVLLHRGEIIAIYNDSGDAYDIGCEKYGLGNFSYEFIGQKPISLGIRTMLIPEST